LATAVIESQDLSGSTWWWIQPVDLSLALKSRNVSFLQQVTIGRPKSSGQELV
jgi:hypothetical protein